MNCDNQPVAILGSILNGGACQIIDCAKTSNSNHEFLLYDDIAYLSHTKYLGCEIRGGLAQLELDLRLDFSKFVVGVCSLPFRHTIFEDAQLLGLEAINIISNLSVISESDKIGAGNIILPSTYIGPNVNIGCNNYITCGTHINHDTNVGNSNYFSTSVAVAGRVNIGNRIRLGSNSTIVADSCIRDNTTVEEGAVYGSNNPNN